MRTKLQHSKALRPCVRTMQATMGDGRRKLLVAFAVLQNVFVGGIVFGWAGIAGTLLIAPKQDGGAGLTLDQTTDIFAMAAFFASFSSLPLGIVLDNWGPRVASLLSNAIIGIGIQTMASAHSYTAFAAGTCLTAFGGPGIQISLVHLANLFPDNLFFVMSLVNGSISCSFAILPIFSMLWETCGIGIRPMFQAYLFVVFASALGSLLLWPDSPYQKDDSGLHELLLTPKTRRTPFPPASPQKMVEESTKHTHLIEQPLDSYLRSNGGQLNRHESFLVSKKALEEGQVSLVSLKDSPFRKQFRSGTYIRMLAIFVATSFFANFYIASITTEFSDYDDMQWQHEMTNRFSLIMSFGLLGSLIAGWLMDVIGLETCTFMTLVLGQAHMLIIVFFGEHMPLMTLGFVIYTLFRCFLYPVFIASLSARLGFKYFGILSGIGFAISGLAQLCIAPLVHAVQGSCAESLETDCDNGAWPQLHIIQLVLFLLLGFIPLWDHRVEVQRQKAIELSKIFSSTPIYGAMESSWSSEESAIEL